MTPKESRNFWLTLSGKGVSQFGSKLFGFAMSFYILKITGSAQNFAISLLITTLPAVLLSPVAGVIADRANKKRIVVGADFISGMAMLAFFIVLQKNDLTLWQIYLAELILSVLFVFLSNAFSSSYPNLVAKERLTKINAYSQGLDSVLSIATPILGGVLYGVISIEWFFLVNAISFLLSALSECFIDFHLYGGSLNHKKQKGSFIQTMKDGFVYVRSQKTFMTIAIYALFINFFMSAFTIVMPYNLITVHGISAQSNGLIQSLFPVGAIIMSIYVGKKSVTFSHALLRNTMIMFGLLMVAFAIPTLPGVSFGWGLVGYYGMMMALMAMVVILVNVPLQVLFQTLIEDAYRGRAMGVLGAFAQGVMPVAYLITGLLIDQMPSYLILFGAATALLLISLSIHNNNALKEVAVSPT